MTDYTNGEIGKELSKITEDLKSKIKELVESKNTQLGLSKGLDRRKGEFLKEAYALADPEGKPQLKNQDLRDSYVTQKIIDLPASLELTKINEQIKILEAEITGLDYEFQARKACMNFVTATLRRQGE